MSNAGAHEELLRQRWKDLEGKKVHALIAGQSGHPLTTVTNIWPIVAHIWQ